MPELYLAMNEHVNKGEIEAARAIQYDADRIIYKMCEAHGNLYAVQKEILRRMYGLELGGVREPMPGLIPEDEANCKIEAAPLSVSFQRGERALVFGGTFYDL